MHLPGSAQDKHVSWYVTVSRGPGCSTLLEVASDDTDDAALLLHLARPAAVSHLSHLNDGPLACKRVFPDGQVQCCCDNKASPRSIRGIGKCGRQKCGGLAGQGKVCVCVICFPIPTELQTQFHDLLNHVCTSVKTRGKMAEIDFRWK